MSARHRSHGTSRFLALLGVALVTASTAAPVAAHPSAAALATRAGTTLMNASRATGDLPSIHWLHAEEHAGDRISFEPGERVTVPFKPRPDDTWEVDGKAPKALPAGNATGRQMRDAPEGSVWAAGAPGRSEQAGPPVQAQPHAPAPHPAPLGTGTDLGVDQPVGAAGAVGNLASASGSSTGADGDGPVVGAPVGPNGLRREVFGFLPYWELSDRSTVLDWRVLSTVAYFSVGCRANGDLAKRQSDGSLTTGWAGWTSSRMTSIINAAHEHGSRVVLTVSCFAWSSSNARTQASLLGSSTARQNLARQIAAAVRDRGADGVNLDFEPIVSGYADEFTLLVRRVRTELNNVAPGYQLTFDTMGSIGNAPIADATAPGGADAVFVMGYDYRTAGSNYAGSIAPLSGPVYDLTDTVKAYTSRISPSKVILGVPWYGRAWSTASDALHARTLDPAKYGGSATPFYADAVDILRANGRRWDSVEQSPWTAYRRQTCTSAYGCLTSWRQLYVDDAASMKLRYDLVNRQGLRGVGIWALGYDDGRTEMRAALADKFLADRTAPVVGTTALASTQRDEGFRVSWKSWDDSSIDGYDIDVSVDGGAWSRWLTGTTATSAVYRGADGHTYAFRIRAADVHGNASAWSPSIDLSALTVPDSLAVGGFATVLTDGLRMRTSASTDASIMATLSAGDALRVIGGPASRDGYTWFQVAGPMKQWPAVDQPQVGGWIAAYGNGVENAAPRRPIYATRVDAGITGLQLNDGGLRVLTPNGDGDHDRLRVEWTNEVALDSLTLRIHRLDGSVVGSVNLGDTGAGGHAYTWDGRIGGVLVPAGSYVAQLRGEKGSTTFTAPSASPTTNGQASRFGFIVGPATPTEVVQFKPSPTGPTRSGTISYSITFGGAVRWLLPGDIVRTGSATGCELGQPSGSATSWSITVRGCSAGTVKLTLKPETVADAVANWGPASQTSAPTVLIDRSDPVASKPKVSFRTGTGLTSTAASTGTLTAVTWSGTDPGGAGIRDYDVRRSVDGGAWRDVAVNSLDATIWQTLSPGHTYRYQVRARDRAGNVGGWVAGPTVRPSLVQNGSAAIRWRGTWKLGTSDHYSGGTVRFATAAGASVRYAFTGRGVALVTTLGPDRGAVKVYLDGVLVRTIDTYSPTYQFRRVVFSRSWAASGSHTLRLVVVGTSGHPRVDLDALEVLR